MFLEEEYGIRPKECNVKLEYKIIEKKIYPNLVIEKIGMYYKDLEMIFYIYMPNKKNKNLILNFFIDFKINISYFLINIILFFN